MYPLHNLSDYIENEQKIILQIEGFKSTTKALQNIV